MNASARPGAAQPKAALFDLLTALIDSWSLWNSVAGNAEDGRRWRTAYLNITYAAGRYRPYEALVREAAQSIGLSPDLGDRLTARYGELAPWPEAKEVVVRCKGSCRSASSPTAPKPWAGSPPPAPGSYSTSS
jgi:hypothetical protein